MKMLKGLILFKETSLVALVGFTFIIFKRSFRLKFTVRKL